VTGVLSSNLSDSEWLVSEVGFDLGRANTFETMFTTGNGAIGTRGSLEEGHPGALSGVYLNGVFDAHDSIVTDMVNAPDWLDTEVHVNGVRLDVENCRVISHQRVLDMSQGVLWRATVFEDTEGRQTSLETLRFASLAWRDTLALAVEVTPLGHDATVEISTGIQGDRRNLEALPVYPSDRTFPVQGRWEKWARSQHLAALGTGVTSDGILHLSTRTIQSNVTLDYAAAITCAAAEVTSTTSCSSTRVTSRMRQHVAADQTLRVDKFVAIATTRDPDQPRGADNTAVLNRARAAAATGMSGLLEANAAAWADLWQACDASVVGKPELTQAVRFSIYHLLIAANPDDPTVNIGAKSLSGEGYRGHVFWDTEVMLLPFYVLTQPATAKALLCYRHHTLDGARRNSTENGTLGARFAWESADTGDEECPRFTPDGKNRFWTRDEELHVSADVAYGIHRYVEATGDETFLREWGAEMLFETARFWVSRIERADGDPQGHLRQVMGPDEFHSHVADNAFTNRLVQWNLRYAASVFVKLVNESPEALAEISARIGLDPGEVAGWRIAAEDLAVGTPNSEGVVEQFEGYFDRLDVPVNDFDENSMPKYPPGYNHFNCEETQLLKQPDVLMLAFMLPDLFDTEVIRANFEYYEPRTLHKSSLSPAIHAIIGIEVGETARAQQYFERSAFVDLADNQGNTCEGMHIASAAGTWAVLVNGFGGLRVDQGQLSIGPWIPQDWEGVTYRVTWRGLHLAVVAGHGQTSITATGQEGATLTVLVHGEPLTLAAGTTVFVTDPARAGMLS